MTQSSSADFTRMPIWQKAQAFAASVASVVSRLPRDRAADVIANQLLRAAGSIPANIAEGYGRYSQAAYRSHLSIARGSAFEAESWIDLLHRQGFITGDMKSELLAGCHEVGKLLTLRMKSLGPAKQSYAVREEKAIYEID